MSSKMFNILEHLANTSSRKDKESILKNLSSLDEQLFLDVAKYALDPKYDYYIKEFDVPESHNSDLLSVADAFPLLENLNDRELTGDQARQALTGTLARLSPECAEVFARIVRRDLRCGVSSKTVNKVWPDHIYIHPYMRASAFSEKNLKNIEYPCISQTKMDGLYCDIIVREDSVEYRTRNGSFLPITEWDSELTSKFKDIVLQGELLALDEDEQIMERSLSNGYINSKEVDGSRLAFYAWDCVALSDFEKRKCNVPYMERNEMLLDVCNSLGSWFNLVDATYCEGPDDVLEHFKEKRAEGEEGTIVKNLDMPWKDGTSKEQVKVKVEFSAEFSVIGYKPGKGKHEGLVGSLDCETSDGLLRVNVGGFTDAVRQQITDDIDTMIESGTIIEVKANDIVTNQDDREKYSLFLPRFVEIRTDKTEADSYERVVEQMEAYTQALKIGE